MNLVKDQRFFANKLELIYTINSTMNKQSQLNCITSAGRPNFPIYKALEEGGRETSQQLYWMAIQFGRPNNLERAPMGVQGQAVAQLWLKAAISQKILWCLSYPQTSKVQVFLKSPQKIGKIFNLFLTLLINCQNWLEIFSHFVALSQCLNVNY